MDDDIKKIMRKKGVQRSAALRIHAKPYKASEIAESVYSSVYDDEAKKKTTKKRKRKSKMWIRRDVRRPGMFRRLIENWGWASKGESIPLWIKEQGCEKPAKTYKKITGKKLKKTRLFQKQACLARTFYKFPVAHRGPAKYHRYDASIPSKRRSVVRIYERPSRPRRQKSKEFNINATLVIRVLVNAGLDKDLAKKFVRRHLECIDNAFSQYSNPEAGLKRAVKHVLLGEGRENSVSVNKCCL